MNSTELICDPEAPQLVPQFKSWGKIERFRNVTMTLTEKLDGTNAQIFVPDDPSQPVLSGSRTRWVTSQHDNFGFGRFVEEHMDVLRLLGPGRHYGEWWGKGIQRQYGLTERRLSLFAVERFTNGIPPKVSAELGSSLSLVPVLYQGPFDSLKVKNIVEDLYNGGSVAVPGWMKPEGIVINAVGHRWKVTDNGDQHKGQAA